MNEKLEKIDVSPDILIQQILGKALSKSDGGVVINIFIIGKIENESHEYPGNIMRGKGFIGNKKGEKFSVDEIRNLLQKNNGVLYKVADEAGIDEGGLSRFMKNWQIEYKKEDSP